MFAIAFAGVVCPTDLAMASTRSRETSNGIGILADTVALDNAYVRVMQNVAACTAARTPGFGTRTIVALTNVSFRSSKGPIALKRGEVAVFLAREWYEAPTGQYFEVAFKTNHPPLTAPDAWVEPTKNTVVYEDEEFRVFEERLAGGDQRPLHSHAQRVVVRLNEVQLTDPRFYEVPLPGTGIQVPNTVRFAEPVVHAVRNTSKGDLFNIVIEFKIPHLAQVPGSLKYSDEFRDNAFQWIAEFEHPADSRLSVANGTLDVQSSAGATIWFKNLLSGNIRIAYQVMVVDSGGAHDRVSDLNAFWMARDTAGKQPFGRNGKFSSYDDLQLYYAGIGGNNNTTSRFRKYLASGGKPIVKEYLDKEHLLKGNKRYSIRIEVVDGRTSLWVDDVLYFDFTDNQPLTSGYFGFRTTRSHQRFEHFKVYRLAP